MRRSVFLITCLFLTVIVTSHAIPNYPMAVDDDYYTGSNTTLVVPQIDGLLVNDTPYPGALIVTFDLTGLYGSLSAINNLTGAFTYDPGLFTGTTGFEYSIGLLSDLLDNGVVDNPSNVASVRIQVPDGGITLILLGLGITGLALLRRKLT